MLTDNLVIAYPDNNFDARLAAWLLYTRHQAGPLVNKTQVTEVAYGDLSEGLVGDLPIDFNLLLIAQTYADVKAIVENTKSKIYNLAIVGDRDVAVNKLGVPPIGFEPARRAVQPMVSDPDLWFNRRSDYSSVCHHMHVTEPHDTLSRLVYSYLNESPKDVPRLIQHARSISPTSRDAWILRVASLADKPHGGHQLRQWERITSIKHVPDVIKSLAMKNKESLSEREMLSPASMRFVGGHEGACYLMPVRHLTVGGILFPTFEIPAGISMIDTFWETFSDTENRVCIIEPYFDSQKSKLDQRVYLGTSNRTEYAALIQHFTQKHYVYEAQIDQARYGQIARLMIKTPLGWFGD